MAQITRLGYGQVEDNHLSGKRTGQIYAQLPVTDDIEILENGRFLKYDVVAQEANLASTAGEWMLVYNEEKLYDPRYQSHKDFALIKDNFTPGSTAITHYGVGPFPGQMYTRLVKTNVGDIYTTNTLEKANTSNMATVQTDKSYDAGDVLVINEDGFLEKGTAVAGQPAFVVANTAAVNAITTMPDGQKAVHIQRIQ